MRNRKFRTIPQQRKVFWISEPVFNSTLDKMVTFLFGSLRTRKFLSILLMRNGLFYKVKTTNSHGYIIPSQCVISPKAGVVCHLALGEIPYISQSPSVNKAPLPIDIAKFESWTDGANKLQGILARLFLTLRCICCLEGQMTVEMNNLKGSYASLQIPFTIFTSYTGWQRGFETRNKIFAFFSHLLTSNSFDVKIRIKILLRINIFCKMHF